MWLTCQVAWLTWRRGACQEERLACTKKRRGLASQREKRRGLALKREKRRGLASQTEKGRGLASQIEERRGLCVRCLAVGGRRVKDSREPEAVSWEM